MVTETNHTVPGRRLGAEAVTHHNIGASHRRTDPLPRANLMARQHPAADRHSGPLPERLMDAEGVA
jgi:hypothetical protein